MHKIGSCAMEIIPEFNNLTDQASDLTHIPVSLEIRGDVDTPVSVYLKIRDLTPYSFLLESASQSGLSGRYSFIGIEPELIARYNNGELKVITAKGIQEVDEPPIEYLRSLINKHKVPENESMPPFTGGLIGYFSYDSISLFEDGVKLKSEPNSVDDFCLMLAHTVIVFDHYSHTIKIINLTETSGDLKNNYDQAVKKIKRIKDIIKDSFLPVNNNGAGISDELLDVKDLSPKNEFMKNVRESKENILKGDVFQIVLSRKYEISIECDTFEIYRELRRTNPSPYMFYLKLDDLIVTGSSPEVLVNCFGDKVTTRPLAGTRRRGKTSQLDMSIEKQLLNDPKEKAEHVMLVDLGRNDIGKFCKYGSVKVEEFMGIERYSHVMHIVSEVSGKLAKDLDCFDVLAGSFPAGTVSGAPKVKAMELIDSYENLSRGIYAGTVGYFDFHKNMDTCIAIRTIIIKGKTAHVQAGAGIVADSVPENEYYETINKAQALINAISIAEGKRYDLDD